MKNKFLSLSVAAAVLAAVFYFLRSVINLIGYAISNRILSENSSPIIQFTINNYKTLNISFISILILTSIIIYLSFICLSKKQGKKALMISSAAILLTTLVSLLLFLLPLINSNLLSFLSISPSKMESYTGIFFFLFGLSLIFSKLDNKISRLLGTFYILEAFLLLSSSLLPVRLAEFTIAIRITEAFFFQQEKHNYSK